MSSLLEMAWNVVANNDAVVNMTKSQILEEIKLVYAGLSAIEKGEAPAMAAVAEEEPAPAITKRKAFGKKKITCMICGKEMTTLTRHLKTSHDMKPGAYRKQFGIPAGTALAAKDYSESRRQMAIDRGLGDNLAKARAARGKKKPVSKTVKAKTTGKRTARKPAGESTGD
jgi:predicted transcriptional regulator